MSQAAHRLTAALLLLALLTLVSPGTAQDEPAVGSVTGKILFEGKPLPSGTVAVCTRPRASRWRAPFSPTGRMS